MAWREQVRERALTALGIRVKREMVVVQQLPLGVEERANLWGLREAWGYVDGQFVEYHYCDRCVGWILGGAVEVSENTLCGHRLSGRSGTCYRCVRCGYQIGFAGAIA